MTTDPVAVDPSATAHDAAQAMRAKGIRRLPVVDDGRPVGIVSLGDLTVARDERSALAEISAQDPDR